MDNTRIASSIAVSPAIETLIDLVTGSDPVAIVPFGIPVSDLDPDHPAATGASKINSGINMIVSGLRDLGIRVDASTVKQQIFVNTLIHASQ